MERVPKPFLILAVFLIAFLTTSSTTEGGGEILSDNEVSDPQSFSGPSPTFDPSSFPRYPWLDDFKGQDSSKDKDDDYRGSHGDDRFPFHHHHRGFPWCPWFWGIHGFKETGIDKNQGFYDAQFPIFHHGGFPWFPWFEGTKAGATMNDVAMGEHGYGNRPKADGSKVAGETP